MLIFFPPAFAHLAGIDGQPVERFLPTKIKAAAGVCVVFSRWKWLYDVFVGHLQTPRGTPRPRSCISTMPVPSLSRLRSYGWTARSSHRWHRVCSWSFKWRIGCAIRAGFEPAALGRRAAASHGPVVRYAEWTQMRNCDCPALWNDIGGRIMAVQFVEFGTASSARSRSCAGPKNSRTPSGASGRLWSLACVRRPANRVVRSRCR